MSGSGITEWNAKGVIDQVSAAIESNMEDAAKLVETDAKNRLLRIKEPKFGIAYRRVLALYRLTNMVKRDGKAIVAEIGIPRGEKGDSYGYYIEIGSRTAAAHPWLRPALLTNIKDIVKLLRG